MVFLKVIGIAEKGSAVQSAGLSVPVAAAATSAPGAASLGGPGRFPGGLGNPRHPGGSTTED